MEEGIKKFFLDSNVSFLNQENRSEMSAKVKSHVKKLLYDHHILLRKINEHIPFKCSVLQ